LDQSEQHLYRAVKIARLAGYDVGLAMAEARLAATRMVQGHLAEADRYFQQAIPILRKSGSPVMALYAVMSRLWMHEYRLEHEEFEALVEWMRPMLDEFGGSFILIIRRYIGALVTGNQGRLSQALSDLHEVHRLAELNGDRFIITRIPNALGWLHRELLDMETALKWDGDGVRIAREMGCDEAEANSHVNLGHDYLALGEPARAWEHLEEAARIFERDVWNRWRYNLRLQAERASYWIARGDLKQAASHAAASLEQSKATLSRKHWAWGHKLLGDIALLEDRAPDAGREYEQALSILERHRCPIIEWRILRAAAEAARRLHDTSLTDDFRARARQAVQSLAESITEPSLRERFLASQPIRDI